MLGTIRPNECGHLTNETVQPWSIRFDKFIGRERNKCSKE